MKKSPKYVKGQLRHDFNPVDAVRLHQRLANIDMLEPLCIHRSYPHIIGGHDGSMVQVALIAGKSSFGAGRLRRQPGAARTAPMCFSTRRHSAVQEGLHARPHRRESAPSRLLSGGRGAHKFDFRQSQPRFFQSQDTAGVFCFGIDLRRFGFKCCQICLRLNYGQPIIGRIDFKHLGTAGDQFSTFQVRVTPDDLTFTLETEAQVSAACTLPQPRATGAISRGSSKEVRTARPKIGSSERTGPSALLMKMAATTIPSTMGSRNKITELRRKIGFRFIGVLDTKGTTEQQS
ncbi:MAG: hypothetical protein WC048_16000 [Rhizobium sp.]